MGLRAGDRLSLHELAAGMLSVSGNDAANAAGHCHRRFPFRICRSDEQACGPNLASRKTHFVTPSGLDAEGP